MNKERAREIFKSLGKCLSDNEAILRLDEKDIKELTQALDIAIESLEQDQETKEKMWAKQLNECEECEVINKVETYERKE